MIIGFLHRMKTLVKETKVQYFDAKQDMQGLNRAQGKQKGLRIRFQRNTNFLYGMSP
jgi:hypothetical protein